MLLLFVRLTSPYRLQMSQVKSLFTEADTVMDLQAASKLTGVSSQLAKIGALLCFVLACGILIASLARASSHEPVSPAHQTRIFATR